jgi:crossover junction endodeoxyribonuclease RuvC
VKVLGIDPGTRTTGYGIVSKAGGSKLVYVCEGRIVLDTGAPLSERLLVISKTLNRIVEEYRPDNVSVEALFFARNVKSSIMLGHARGVAFLSAAAFGIPVFEYSPTKIKQAVVGYGGATKQQVQKMVKLLLNTSEDSKPDAADALAAAICHIHHSGGISNTLRRRTLASSR